MQGGEGVEAELSKSLKEQGALGDDKKLRPLAQWSKNALFFEMQGGIFDKPYDKYNKDNQDTEKRSEELLEPFVGKKIPPGEATFAFAMFHAKIGFLQGFFGSIRDCICMYGNLLEEKLNYTSPGGKSTGSIQSYDPASGDITIKIVTDRDGLDFHLLEAECVLNPRNCTIRYNEVKLHFKESDLDEDKLQEIKKYFPADQNNVIYFTSPEIKKAEEWIEEVRNLTNSEACINNLDNKKVIAEVVASAESLIKDMPTCLSPEVDFQIKRFKKAIEEAKKLPIIGKLSLWNVLSVFIFIPNIINYFFVTNRKQFWMRDKTAIEKKTPEILGDNKNTQSRLQ
jgi:hypothetical protein